MSCLSYLHRRFLYTTYKRTLYFIKLNVDSLCNAIVIKKFLKYKTFFAIKMSIMLSRAKKSFLYDVVNDWSLRRKPKPTNIA